MLEAAEKTRAQYARWKESAVRQAAAKLSDDVEAAMAAARQKLEAEYEAKYEAKSRCDHPEAAGWGSVRISLRSPGGRRLGFCSKDAAEFEANLEADTAMEKAGDELVACRAAHSEEVPSLQTAVQAALQRVTVPPAETTPSVPVAQLASLDQHTAKLAACPAAHSKEVASLQTALKCATAPPAEEVQPAEEPPRAAGDAAARTQDCASALLPCVRRISLLSPDPGIHRAGSHHRSCWLPTG